MNLLPILLASVREPTFARALNLFRQETERARPRLTWAFLVRDGTLWRDYFCRVSASALGEVRQSLAECSGAPVQGHWITLPGPRGRQTPRRVFAVHDQAALALGQDDPDFRAAFTLVVHHFRQRDDAAGTDYLTGLSNRRGFDEALRQMMHLQRRHRFDFSVGLLDLDRFKELNDREGHAHGDACLVTAAARLREALRESDTIARHGGDEFSVLLPYAGPSVLPLLRQRIARVLGPEAPFSASLGLVCVPADRPLPNLPELIEQTDAALYKAKASAPGGFRGEIWAGGAGKNLE